MTADVVVGQSNFTDSSSGTSQSKFSSVIRGVFVDPRGRLLVSDFNNHRVLVWNNIPSTNGILPDLVLGQADFDQGSANRGGSVTANTLSTPTAIYSDGNKLFVADRGNDRILIWNTFPTQNGQAADIAVGASNLTSNPADACNASTFQDPYGITVYDNKLLVVDRNQRRVLIWNSLPTSSGTSADMVIGEQDLTTCSLQSTSQKDLNDPRVVKVDSQGRVFVADLGNKRILIWNTFPTTNYALADVVVGQTDFVSSSTGGTTANSFAGTYIGIHLDGTRLYVNDKNRVLIFNSIPTASGASADIVLGQPDFTSNTANNGGIGSNTLSNISDVFVSNNKLFVNDEGNARVLIFTNTIKHPDLTLSSSPSTTNGKLTMSGTATVESPYRLSSVQYAVNGGSFSGATPTDGNFDSSNEAYSFTFAPTDNQPVDSSGSPIPGYTIRVKSTNNNADTIDNLFFMSPFTLHSPDNYAQTQGSTLSFEFSVNKQKNILKDSLSKYQILVKKLGSSTWETLIDDIPVDFRTMKDSPNNKQRGIYGHLDTDNGVYETDSMVASYREESSKIKVYSKTKTLSSGAYKWKAIAVNNGGNLQETEERTLYVNITPAQASSTTNPFPLAILNISGIGDPHINSYNLSSMQDSYTTSSPNPIFYGIAYVGSTVTLTFTQQDCASSCTQTFTTTTNPESRWGINIPMGALIPGSSYTLKASVRLGERYMEVPEFVVSLH